MRIVPLILLGMLPLGCASGGRVVDFSRGIDLSALNGLREEPFPKVGEWRAVESALTNVIPPGASAEEVLRFVDGAGVSLAVIRDFAARDVLVEGYVSFEGTGAPCFVFRVQEEEGIAKAMYSLSLFAQGINLGCLRDGRWVLVHKMVFPVHPMIPHLMRLRVEGSSIAAELDGQQLFKIKDKALVERGAAGICGREGPCYFHSLTVRSLD